LLPREVIVTRCVQGTLASALDGKTAAQSEITGDRPPSEVGSEGVFARARRDTVEAAHSVKFFASVATLDALLGGTVTLIVSKSGASTSETIAAGIAGALGGMLVSLLGAFGLRLVLAPFRQREEAREAHRKAVAETVEARAEGERQLAKAREDAARGSAEAAARVAELEAPEDDPDPRIALANRAEHRASRLRALCRKWEGRISGGELLSFGVANRRVSAAVGDALAAYEGDHSVQTREVFDQLAAEGVLDPEERGRIEDPRFLDDLRTAARLMQEAAERLRACEPGPSRKPAERLNDALSQAMKLRTRVLLRPDEKLPFAEDPLFQWAKSVYSLLVADFPGHADQFYGDDPSLGPANFGMSFAFGIDTHGRAGYLERGIALLTSITQGAHV
jgi:hypothetical protein